MSLPPALGAGPFGVSLGIIPRTLEDSPDVPSFPALPFSSKSLPFLCNSLPCASTSPFPGMCSPHYRNTCINTLSALSGPLNSKRISHICFWHLAGTWGTQISVSIDSVWWSGDVWKRGGRNQSFGGCVRGKGGSLPPWLKLNSQPSLSKLRYLDHKIHFSLQVSQGLYELI